MQSAFGKYGLCAFRDVALSIVLLYLSPCRSFANEQTALVGLVWEARWERRADVLHRPLEAVDVVELDYGRGRASQAPTSSKGRGSDQPGAQLNGIW